MRTISEQTPSRTEMALIGPVRIVRLGRILGGILSLGLVQNAVQNLNAAPPASYSVALAWDGSTSADVTGYRLYYGAASGNYTNSLALGNVTTGTVSGLAGGVPYFFAVTAYDTNGLESPFSNEFSFVPGVPTVQISVPAAGQVVITVTGLNGHTYDIQATQDFNSWVVIGTVILGASGSQDFTDTNAPNVSPRFYRAQDRVP
jgi:hypothetical protein